MSGPQPDAPQDPGPQGTSRPLAVPGPPRAFKVETAEGSVFIMRLDPLYEYAGVQLGRLRVVGKSVTTGLSIDWSGAPASEPLPGGRVVVHPDPVSEYEFEGKRVKSFREEEICYVREIPVPEEHLRKSRSAGPLLADEE